MRVTLAAVLIAFMASGCLHTKVYPNYEEQCADKGMVLAGLDSSRGSSYAYNPVSQQYAVGSSVTRHVRCNVPKTDKEKCQIKARSDLVHEMRGHNMRVSDNNTWIGLGYLLYIVPGVVGYFYWADDSREQQQKILAKRSEIIEKCEAQAVAH